MSFSKIIKTIEIIGIGLLLGEAKSAFAYELYVFRVFDKSDSLTACGKVVLHGELFGQLQSPSTFPSYNDLSGDEDRWNFGFHNYLMITPSTLLHIQLVTHDDGRNRTKFDWHFSLRQEFAGRPVLVIGHDSDHDSDHVSRVAGKLFYNNRNYIGLGIPLGNRNFVAEPFVRFFHHTNQRLHLDLSGEKLRQEIGLRLGGAPLSWAGVSFQIVWQSSRAFRAGEAFFADLGLRFRTAAWLELVMGGAVWADRLGSPDGNKQSFYKLFWGIDIPF